MTKKKKIAVIGLKGLPAFGGAAAVGENIIEQLKNEFEFTVLSTASHTYLKSGYINGFKQIVFRNFGKGSINTMLYYLKSMVHCLVNKYDLVHLHHAGSGFITPIIRLRSKVIVTFHGVHSYKDPKFNESENWFFRFSEKLNVKYANDVISVSKPDQEYIISKYEKKIKYIPNGISLDFTDNINEIQKSKKSYVLFAAGRIFQTKGLHIFLEAAKKINLELEIYIAGDMEQVKDYKNSVLESKGDLKISFLGLIKDKEILSSIIKDADFFVFPSLNEAMSMMLLEVAALQTPVIASDIPSNKMVFSDEEVLFFESRNSDDLADKLKYALTHKNELRLRAKKAYEKLSTQYTWEKITNQYKEIYYEQMNESILKDFTIDSYQKLLVALQKSGYEFLPYKDFQIQPFDENKKRITLRHDVDARKENSLLFAKIQHSMNIRSTYYFRTVTQSYDEKIIKEIAALGHEIGYHYETMDTSKGNIDKAYDEFCSNLAMFRRIVPVTTICMHGSPLSRFDNRDIWQKYDYRQLGLTAEPYFDLDFNQTFYLTDTGRRWDGVKVNMRDKAVGSNKCSNPDFLKRIYKSTGSIIKDIENGVLPNQIMMTFHPQRWTDNKSLWIWELIKQNITNEVKRMVLKNKKKE